jgi:hypothetical protein
MKLIVTFEVDDETDRDDIQDLLDIVARDLSALDMKWKIKREPPEA